MYCITDPDLSICAYHFLYKTRQNFCNFNPMKFKFHNDLKKMVERQPGPDIKRKEEF